MELYAYGEAKAGRRRPRTTLLARPRRAPGPRPVSPARPGRCRGPVSTAAGRLPVAAKARAIDHAARPTAPRPRTAPVSPARRPGPRRSPDHADQARPASSAHVKLLINRDHELVSLRAFQPAGSVVQRCNGPTGPGTATGHPRAISRGRRAATGESSRTARPRTAHRGTACA